MAAPPGGISLYKVSHFQRSIWLRRKTKVKRERGDSGGGCDGERARENTGRATLLKDAGTHG